MKIQHQHERSRQGVAGGGGSGSKTDRGSRAGRAPAAASSRPSRLLKAAAALLPALALLAPPPSAAAAAASSVSSPEPEPAPLRRLLRGKEGGGAAALLADGAMPRSEGQEQQAPEDPGAVGGAVLVYSPDEEGKGLPPLPPHDADWLPEELDGAEDVDLASWLGSIELPGGADPGDYNLTFYDEETGREFTEQEFFSSQRGLGGNGGGRSLIAVNSNEFKNAKFIQYERVSRGLGGLGWSIDLIKQAQMWARYMASTGDFEHRSQLGAGVRPGWRYIAENIAMNMNIGRDGAHRALMNSQGHRENILSTRIGRLGIGVARSGDGYYYMCQIFKGV